MPALRIECRGDHLWRTVDRSLPRQTGALLRAWPAGPPARRVLGMRTHSFNKTGFDWLIDDQELLYADDLVLIADTQEECISKLKAWKAGMESKGLCVNMKKTKILVSDDDQDVLQKSDKYPCVVYCCGVDRNSILCSQPECMLRVHKTCSGITKQLVEDPNYICPRWQV